VKGLHIWLLIAVVLGASALGMACKSKKKTAGTSTPKTTVSKTVANKTGTPAVKTGTPAKTGTPSSSANNGAPNLSDLVNKVGTKTVKATYTFSGTGATGEETFTLYSRRPDSRVDVTSGGQTSIFISAGGTDYICYDSSQTCSVSPVPLASTLPFLAFVTDPQALSGVVGSGLDHSTKTVAGEDADCYSASAAGATSEVCFNNDGILVRLHAGVSGSDFTMEATSVSGTVSDSDLTPPYSVQ
jgi:hypothetical protein